jgi:hypothetical protein
MAGTVTGTPETLALLAVLTDREKAEVLDCLIAQDPTLAVRAGCEGRGVLAAVEIDAVASAVADALLGLDQEELSQHAGRTRYGYVEPTTAAWSLLEAALGPWLEDIARRASLGFHGPARQIGLGVLQGLHKWTTTAAATNDCCRGRRTSRTRHAKPSGGNSPVSASSRSSQRSDCRSAAAGPRPAPSVADGSYVKQMVIGTLLGSRSRW